MQALRSKRVDQKTRDSYAETKLTSSQFILPLFVVPGKNISEDIPGLPHIRRNSTDRILPHVEKAFANGVQKFLLFGTCEQAAKAKYAEAASFSNGAVQQALKILRANLPEAFFITDVCLCAYTDHGHCGIPVKKGTDWIIDNDRSLEPLVKAALSHAQAGAHMVAPSAMMDGQVGAIRAALDDQGHGNIPIMGYSVKYASNYYGPFRQAVDSAPSFGDRKTYQMDYRNAREAIAEVEADLEEGASWLMVKPALPYLDVIRSIKDKFPSSPLAAYQVSGEYAGLHAAAAAGVINLEQGFEESLTAIARSGADYIISYYSEVICKRLMELT